MFYYPAVLKRHTGCFSTIWLVATKGVRVPRRDFLKVNVKTTCEDIMSYVLEQVPPPLPDLPRPRFSLYLSSQLQYGVIVVFHRQCAILLEELHSIVGQLLKQRISQKIDMDDQKQSLVLPDALSLMEEAEGAPDPFFGVMNMQDAMPSPSVMIQRSAEYLREPSPEPPELGSPAAVATPESAITTSPETITLREPETVTIPTPEFEGEDLVDQTPDVIDFLLETANHFDLEEEMIPAEQEREIEREEREEDREKERAKELTTSTLELQPPSVTSEEAILLPQEEPLFPGEKPESPTDQLTPVSVPAFPSPPPAPRERQRPSLELEDVSPPREKRRRKRQLIFFDSETQIPPEVLQQQIDNPLIETRRSPPPRPPSHRRRSAADLLNEPCIALPDEILSLWRQAAVITPDPSTDLQVGERGPESTDSEKERELAMAEAEEVPEREEERLYLSPKEVPRDLPESEVLDISGLGTIPLEGSDQREVSREVSPLLTSEREESIVSRSVSTLPDIPEAVDRFPGRAAAEYPWRLLDLPEYEGEAVTFHSLLPPDVNRLTLSIIFQRLLEAASARKVQVEQDEPYGDIFIFPGPDSE
ncbi:meiotic recombination protein REC8 homolog [Mastacembelus armatus]|uniref:meiotic recombination protein REC8 homolog n=1 Tax=Mastacembelus armatus TaxID=205130 RepID=UPI000E45AD0D|nr:meiotic recombination protein REC8 homolog [Mastacembelus armatus]